MGLFHAALQPALDANGDPISGATWNFYTTGTLTPANVYSTNALSVSLGSTVTSNAAGRFSTIFLDDEVTYRAILKDASGSTIKDIDPINSENGAAAIVTPGAYSAVGDGSTNDITPLTNLQAANPGRLVLGEGLTYRITSNLPAGFNMLDGKISDSRTVQTNDEWSVLALGWDAGKSNTFIPEVHASSAGPYASGNHNVFLGPQAGRDNTIGRRNVYLGSRSGIGGTTAYYNTGLGSHTFENLTTGYENVAAGTQALGSLTTGNGNSVLGVGAGNKITTGAYNIGIGQSAMSGIGLAACTGTYNIGIGFQSLGQMTAGLDNIALGRLSMQIATTAEGNVAIGSSALGVQETAGFAVAVGYQALKLNTAADNVAVGALTLDSNTTGTRNVAVGKSAGTSVTTSNDGVFVGHQAGLVTTGGNNTVVGSVSAATLTTGTSNTMIGYAADCTATAVNCTSLGNGATCTGDNQVTLGNASTTTIRAQVTTITALSDERFKEDIEPLEVPAGFMEAVEIVTYRWIDEEMPGGEQIGIIAQQLDALQTAFGVDYGLVDKSNPDSWEATPGKLLFLLIPWMQTRFQSLESRVAALEAA